MRTESSGIGFELRRAFATLFAVGTIAGVGFISGYYVGQRRPAQTITSELRGTPVAAGYLNVPDEYSPEVRLNADGAREPILRHESGLELKMIDALPRLITSYEHNPEAMEQAMQEQQRYTLVP